MCSRCERSPAAPTARGTDGSTLTLLGAGQVTMGAASSLLRFTRNGALHIMANIGGTGGTDNDATLGTMPIDTGVTISHAFAHNARAAGTSFHEIPTLPYHSCNLF